MKRILFAIVAILLWCSHDMYLKLDGYFLAPNQSASIELINGTWAESENVIDRDRMQDVSIISGGQRTTVDTNQWRELNNATILDFKTGSNGTYVAGISTRARNIEMEADAFNKYLEHDGVIDMLEWRKNNDALNQAAVEKYSKHVKTVFQVGDQRSDDWKTELGYPIEFIPLSNPYHVHPGEPLGFKLLLNGAPLANQLVTLGKEAAKHGHDHDHGHSHDHDGGHDHSDDGHHHHGDTQVRTAADGTFTVDVDDNGKYYIRTIYMEQSEEEGLTHESNWATISFAVNHNSHQHANHDHGHDHGHEHDHGHDHGEGEHEHEETAGLPSYVYWLGSLALVGILFLYFNSKQS